jgi:hypothetical protein
MSTAPHLCPDLTVRAFAVPGVTMAGPHLHHQLAAEYAGLTCRRATHPHKPDNIQPHLGITDAEDGAHQLVQWTDPDVAQAERPPATLPGQPKQRPTTVDVQRQLAHDIATGQR